MFPAFFAALCQELGEIILLYDLRNDIILSKSGGLARINKYDEIFE